MRRVRVSRAALLASLIVIFTACATPTPAAPAPAATAIPPTATTLPPTATSTATPTLAPPTATSVPPTTTPAPTVTPAPTNTPRPTATKVVTPKPTNTKSAAVSPAVVSSQPSTLQKSIEQTFNAAHDLVGLLSQMKPSSVEFCAPLSDGYRSIHNAPTYDVSGQPERLQQAYALYRQAIAVVDGQADSIQSCGQGGGALSSLNLGMLQQRVTQAVGLLGQASDLAKSAAGLSPTASLAEAVERVRVAVAAIGAAFDRSMGSGHSEPCEPVIADFNLIVNAPTYDMSGQLTNAQTAYALYRQAIGIVADKVAALPEMCNKGGGTLGLLDTYTSRKALREAEGLLIQALSVLEP